MKTIPRATITLQDGSTFDKDLPPWMTSSFHLKEGLKEQTYPKKQKVNSQSNVYYETLKPVFMVLTLAGILPVFRLRIGSHIMQALLGGSICLAVYVLFAYLTYTVTLDIVQLILHDDDFNSVTIQVSLMMLLVQQVFYLLLTWPESIAVHKYLVQWREFEAHYKLVTGRKLQLKCKREVCFWLLFSVGVGLIYPYIVDCIDDKSINGKIGYIVISYHIVIQLCFYHLWFANSSAITEAARQYHSVLADEFSTEVSAERLEDYRLVWMRLTELVRAGSSMLSYTMAFMVTTPFAYQVIAAYNLTMFLIRSIQRGYTENSDEAVATGTTFLFYALLLYTFCNSGHRMTTECEKTQDLLLTYKPSTPLGLAKVNSELRLFLRCIRSVPPLATLSGYVTINRKVFLHLTGVLVTYLIILVQFNISAIQSNPGKKTTVSPLPN